MILPRGPAAACTALHQRLELVNRKEQTFLSPGHSPEAFLKRLTGAACFISETGIRRTLRECATCHEYAIRSGLAQANLNKASTNVSCATKPPVKASVRSTGMPAV